MGVRPVTGVDGRALGWMLQLLGPVGIDRWPGSAPSMKVWVKMSLGMG